MEKIQNSKILKSITYGIIPILVLIIIVHVFSLAYYESCNGEIYVSENQGIYIYDLIYKTVSKTYTNAPVAISISSILLIIAITYVIISIGHKSGQEEIYTDGLDKIPLEIVGIVSGIMLSIEVFILTIFTSLIDITVSSNLINTFISLTLLTGVIIYITLATTGITIIRRIKAKIFWKSTMLYKIIKWIRTIVSNIMEEIFKNPNTTFKLAVTLVGFAVITIILFVLAMNNFFFVLILLAFWYMAFKAILNQINKMYKIRDKIKDMYNGKVKETLNEEEFNGELKRIAVELNDISGGLSNAIEEGLKSERLKTELITNVSHDIKTPLTSIINYVDLLKKENIQDEKVKDYLNILDSKSQRLKKLTEDLIEASKASSGNIKLNIEKLNVKELIKQVSGEFEDKFKEKGLEIIESIPNEDLYINADGRYMFRIMENMYTNIAKYALENSRVYIDLSKKNNKIEIALKNISRDKLNITVDELMQRFVRGDSSRTTEGSGLGISIAKSLTELQNGKFNMYLDGDLFKVVLEFEGIM